MKNLFNSESNWIYRNSNGTYSVDTHKLYIHMSEKFKFIFTKNNNYIYEDGVYKILDSRELKNLIKKHMPVETRTRKQWEAVFDEFATDEFVEENVFNDNEELINFKNGILNIKTNELTEHSPDILSNIQIPCNYIANADLNNAPVFKKYLNDLFGEDESLKTLILEYMGAIISNVKGFRFKKILFLIGKGNTGKTQLREFIISLIDEKNSISMDLKNLNDTFGTALLVNKRLAGCGDLSYAKVKEIDILKELSGGDEVYANPKYKQQFSFRYNGFLWFNGNDTPYFGGDTGKHVYERFLIVPCNNVIPPEKRDANLLEKMLAEKDVIASVCIQYLKRAINRGYKFTEGYEINKQRILYEKKNNSLITFIDEYCKIGTGKTKRSAFYGKYFDWCKLNNLRSEKQSDIKEILFEKYGIEAYKSSEFYYNLTIKDEVPELFNEIRERFIERSKEKLR